MQNLLAYPGLGHSGPIDLDGGGSSGGECPSVCTSQTSTPQVSTLPPAMRVRLYELFVQIEREFEILYAENLSLQEKVDTLTSSNTNQCNQNPEIQQNFLQTTTSSTSLAQHQQQPQQQQQHNNNLTGSLSVPITPATSTTTPLGLGLGLSSNKMSRALYAHKLRTHTNKLKQHTNKIMSNFKGKHVW